MTETRSKCEGSGTVRRDLYGVAGGFIVDRCPTCLSDYKGNRPAYWGVEYGPCRNVWHDREQEEDGDLLSHYQKYSGFCFLKEPTRRPNTMLWVPDEKRRSCEVV